MVIKKKAFRLSNEISDPVKKRIKICFIALEDPFTVEEEMHSGNQPPLKKLKISLSSLKVQPVEYDMKHDFLYSSDRRTAYRKQKRKKDAAYKAKHAQWRPVDDYLLINSVLQLSDITAVYKKVKFTNYYSEKEIEQRWRELLTNQIRSYVALEAIASVPVWIKAQLDRKVPFSEVEEQHLKSISFAQVYPKDASGVIPSKCNYEPFVKLLSEKLDVFYMRRTVKDLFNHWNLLRKNGFIADDPTYNSKTSFQMGGDPENFDDVEYLITNCPEPQNNLNNSIVPLGTPSSLKCVPPFTMTVRNKGHPGSQKTTPSPTKDSEKEVQHELTWLEKQQRNKLRVLGEQANRWTAWLESISNVGVTDRQPASALASLTGFMSRYLIKSKEATFGRRNAVVSPDIDLSCEYHASRISRIQGRIRLDNSGTFHVANFGRRAIFVDGAPLLSGEEMVLRDKAILSISQLNFRFDINPDLPDVEVTLSTDFEKKTPSHNEIPAETSTGQLCAPATNDSCKGSPPDELVSCIRQTASALTSKDEIHIPDIPESTLHARRKQKF